jgi:hypothetical protein
LELRKVIAAESKIIELKARRIEQQKQFLAWCVTAPVSAPLWVMQRMKDTPFEYGSMWACLAMVGFIGVAIGINLPSKIMCRSVNDLCFLMRIDKNTSILRQD